MHVGIAIRSIRRKLDISQNDLAGKCGISITSLSQIEAGLKMPRDKTMKKICDILQVPEAFIYIIALQETDVPLSKKTAYRLVYPSIVSLTLQMVETEYFERMNAA